MSRWSGALLVLVLSVVGCRDSSPVDERTLYHAGGRPQLRVTILADARDARLAGVREALTHWNREFARLGRRLQFDSGAVRVSNVPDSLLRAVSGEVMLGRGPATTQLRERLPGVPGDVVIALSPISSRSVSRGALAITV